MKALALVTVLSLTFTHVANAQDSKHSLKSSGGTSHSSKAVATIDVGAIQKKIDAYTVAINDDPKNDKYYGARGYNYFKLDKKDLAIRDLSRAIKLNPSRQAYFEVRGNCFVQLERYKDAYDDFEKAISIGPPTFALHMKQGQTAVCFDAYDKGLRAAKQALVLKPNDLDALLLAGGCERIFGLTSESLSHLTKAIELYPAHAESYVRRAETYKALGKAELAARDIERATLLKNGR